MALFRRLFYKKPPDRLLEITERVYVFDCCFSSEIMEEREYNDCMDGIVAQLREYFPEGSFLVINFEGESKSQISGILMQHDITVRNYPHKYEGCPLLPLEIISHLLRLCESWLTIDMQQNVLLMHCERGGWPMLAFMLAGFLIYRKQYTGEQRTLDMMYKQASKELLQVLNPLNPQSSHIRYLQYISEMISEPEWCLKDIPFTLDCLILKVVPDFDGEGGCRPIIRVYGQDPLFAADRSSKVLFSTPRTKKHIQYFNQADNAPVKLNIHCGVQGDLVLECINLDEELEAEEIMFRIMFNTSFIKSNILLLNLEDIDIAWDTKDQFSQDFKVEVLFSEFDAESDPNTDGEAIEDDDMEVGSTEEFFEAEEIFSNPEWHDGQRDLDIQSFSLTNAIDDFSPRTTMSNLDEVMNNLELADCEHIPFMADSSVTTEILTKEDLDVSYAEHINKLNAREIAAMDDMNSKVENSYLNVGNKNTSTTSKHELENASDPPPKEINISEFSDNKHVVIGSMFTLDSVTDNEITDAVDEQNFILGTESLTEDTYNFTESKPTMGSENDHIVASKKVNESRLELEIIDSTRISENNYPNVMDLNMEHNTHNQIVSMSETVTSQESLSQVKVHIPHTILLEDVEQPNKRPLAYVLPHQLLPTASNLPSEMRGKNPPCPPPLPTFQTTSRPSFSPSTSTSHMEIQGLERASTSLCSPRYDPIIVCTSLSLPPIPPPTPTPSLSLATSPFVISTLQQPHIVLQRFVSYPLASSTPLSQLTTLTDTIILQSNDISLQNSSQMITYQVASSKDLTPIQPFFPRQIIGSSDSPPSSSLPILQNASLTNEQQVLTSNVNLSSNISLTSAFFKETSSLDSSNRDKTSDIEHETYLEPLVSSSTSNRSIEVMIPPPPPYPSRTTKSYRVVPSQLSTHEQGGMPSLHSSFLTLPQVVEGTSHTSCTLGEFTNVLPILSPSIIASPLPSHPPLSPRIEVFRSISSSQRSNDEIIPLEYVPNIQENLPSQQPIETCIEISPLPPTGGCHRIPLPPPQPPFSRQYSSTVLLSQGLPSVELCEGDSPPLPQDNEFVPASPFTSPKQHLVPLSLASSSLSPTLVSSLSLTSSLLPVSFCSPSSLSLSLLPSLPIESYEEAPKLTIAIDERHNNSPQLLPSHEDKLECTLLSPPPPPSMSPVPIPLVVIEQEGASLQNCLVGSNQDTLPPSSPPSFERHKETLSPPPYPISVPEPLSLPPPPHMVLYEIPSSTTSICYEGAPLATCFLGECQDVPSSPPAPPRRVQLQPPHPHSFEGNERAPMLPASSSSSEEHERDPLALPHFEGHEQVLSEVKEVSPPPPLPPLPYFRGDQRGPLPPPHFEGHEKALPLVHPSTKIREVPPPPPPPPFGGYVSCLPLPPERHERIPLTPPPPVEGYEGSISQPSSFPSSSLTIPSPPPPPPLPLIVTYIEPPHPSSPPRSYANKHVISFGGLGAAPPPPPPPPPPPLFVRHDGAQSPPLTLLEGYAGPPPPPSPPPFGGHGGALTLPFSGHVEALSSPLSFRGDGGATTPLSLPLPAPPFEGHDEELIPSITGHMGAPPPPPLPPFGGAPKPSFPRHEGSPPPSPPQPPSFGGETPKPSYSQHEDVGAPPPPPPPPTLPSFGGETQKPSFSQHEDVGALPSPPPPLPYFGGETPKPSFEQHKGAPPPPPPPPPFGGHDETLIPSFTGHVGAPPPPPLPPFGGAPKPSFLQHEGAPQLPPPPPPFGGHDGTLIPSFVEHVGAPQPPPPPPPFGGGAPRPSFTHEGAPPLPPPPPFGGHDRTLLPSFAGDVGAPPPPPLPPFGGGASKPSFSRHEGAPPPPPPPPFGGNMIVPPTPSSFPITLGAPCPPTRHISLTDEGSTPLLPSPESFQGAPPAPLLPGGFRGSPSSPPPPGGFRGAPPPPPPPGGFQGGPPPPPPHIGGGPPPPPPPLGGREGAPPPPPPFGGHGGAPPPPPPVRGSAPGPPAPPRAPGAPPPPPMGGGGSQPGAKGLPMPPSSLGGRGHGLARPTGPGMLSSARKSSLKPLHWVKVTRAMQGSLWAELQKYPDGHSTSEFDVSELESLFSAVVPKSSDKNEGRGKSAAAKSDKVHLIELRRANNTEIMLTKIKMPLSDMMNAVLALDDSILDADQVENLIKFCPTKEEMELLKNYTGGIESLGKCEQYFLELMKVPRVESKLRVFAFKIQFGSQIADIRKNFYLVDAACEEVRGSDKLKEIMKKILYLGNTLNQGTARGAAVGFRLDSLLKLTDTRATNNKMTLMHYLCKVLAEKSPNLLDFDKDLVSLEAASKVQLKALAEEQQAIVKGLEKVELELTASESDGPVSEIFHKTVKEFIAIAGADVRSLTSLCIAVGKNADSLALYFGEDPARCPFEQVLTTILNFVRMFRRSHEENLKQAELEKKKAQKEAKMEKSETNTVNTTDK